MKNKITRKSTHDVPKKCFQTINNDDIQSILYGKDTSETKTHLVHHTSIEPLPSIKKVNGNKGNNLDSNTYNCTSERYLPNDIKVDGKIQHITKCIVPERFDIDSLEQKGYSVSIGIPLTIVRTSTGLLTNETPRLNIIEEIPEVNPCDDKNEDDKYQEKVPYSENLEQEEDFAKDSEKVLVVFF